MNRLETEEKRLHQTTYAKHIIASEALVPALQSPLVFLRIMVAKGSLGKYQPGKPSPAVYWTVLISLISFSIGGGYLAGTRPNGEWRLFSWHPMLMTSGMVGLAGIGALTKKLGGYTNTKLHALLGWSSIFTSFAGIYVIYRNKEMNGYGHLKTAHSQAGAAVVVTTVGLGLAGSIFLHPDFGVDKTNKTIRLAHKMVSRITLMIAWFTAFYGLMEMIPNEPKILAMYGFPLLILVPLVLI